MIVPAPGLLHVTVAVFAVASYVHVLSGKVHTKSDSSKVASSTLSDTLISAGACDTLFSSAAFLSAGSYSTPNGLNDIVTV